MRSPLMSTIRLQPTADTRTWTLHPPATQTVGREDARGLFRHPSTEAEAHLERRLGLDETPSVLIVEDESSIAELIGDVLESAGYRPLVARNGRTALAIARRERPSLVLTDLMMPEVDGAEFVRRMRASPVTSAIPVVMMSSVRPALATAIEGDTAARRLDQYVLRAMPQAQYTRVGDEVIPFLAKPFDIDDLVDLVDTLVRATHEGTEIKTAGFH